MIFVFLQNRRKIKITKEGFLGAKKRILLLKKPIFQKFVRFFKKNVIFGVRGKNQVGITPFTN